MVLALERHNPSGPSSNRGITLGLWIHSEFHVDLGVNLENLGLKCGSRSSRHFKISDGLIEFTFQTTSNDIHDE